MEQVDFVPYGKSEIDYDQVERLQEFHRARNNIVKRSVIRSDADVEEILINLHTSIKERFVVLFLDTQNGVIREYSVEGTVDQCALYPREIFRIAFECGAAHLIVAHNHPGGSQKFSESDIKITKRIYDAGAALDIQLLDHVLFFGRGTASMKESGSWSSRITEKGV